MKNQSYMYQHEKQNREKNGKLKKSKLQKQLYSVKLIQNFKKYKPMLFIGYVDNTYVAQTLKWHKNDKCQMQDSDDLWGRREGNRTGWHWQDQGKASKAPRVQSIRAH